MCTSAGSRLALVSSLEAIFLQKILGGEHRYEWQIAQSKLFGRPHGSGRRLTLCRCYGVSLC
jgi:hypothetical protein